MSSGYKYGEEAFNSARSFLSQQPAVELSSSANSNTSMASENSENKIKRVDF